MNEVVKRKEGQVVASPADPMLQMIAEAARDPAVDIDKMRALLEMKKEVMHDEARRLYQVAMNAVQKAVKPIAADASNPQTKSKYASYQALDRILRPIYTEHGFSLSFDTGDGAPENHVRVICDVAHEDGHEKRHHIDMPADGKGAKGGDVMTKTHATGSAVSYGKRYLLQMIFNLAVGEDDDGNAAGTGEKISDEQYQWLCALADEVGADKAAFCRWAGVESFPDIPAKDFEKAKAALEQKRAKAAKEPA